MSALSFPICRRAAIHTANLPITWLHLSDFHFKSGDPYDADVVLRSLLVALPNLFQRFGRPDFVIASGDIADTGEAEQYRRATEFFDRIVQITGCSKKHLFIVPGNHDIDRVKVRNLQRTLVSSGEADQYFRQGEPLVHIERGLAAYKQWYDAYFAGIRQFPLDRSYDIEAVDINGRRVCVALFNSATFCCDDHDSGKLFIGRRSIEAANDQLAKLSPDLALAVIHHPFHWLSAIESSNVKAMIHDAFDCVLTGHLHENEVEHTAGSSGRILHFSAGATYQTRKWPNTAMFCAATPHSITVTPIRFTDTPRPVWALDPSLFPNEDTYQATFALNSLPVATPEGAAPLANLTSPVSGGLRQQGDSEPAGELCGQLEERLFVTPDSRYVFVEPRLMTRSQLAALDDGDEASVSASQISSSTNSYFVEGRPEYGSSTLCRWIQLAIARSGKPVVLRNARDIPNYRRKLESEFEDELAKAPERPTLILDDFDTERDERLLSEIYESQWFSRIVIVSVNRRLADTPVIDLQELPFKPEVLFLWALGRTEIRTFASAILDANDTLSEARAVDKVYSDLLGLRIPLTPSNVIMYLRVLQREGDFEPLSKVDILSRYLAESLRKPSDVATDSFNAKNKMDVLSSFAHSMHEQRISDFDERHWLNFCAGYQKSTLSEFNAKSFLGELTESRIFSSYSNGFYFRYSFYFTFFLGRFLWPRPRLIKEFFANDDYLMGAPVVDVISGLSSENSELIAMLIERLDAHLVEFSEKYVRPEFDPLIDAIWPANDEEEEELWKPVQAAIAEGPADSKKIDELKTSMIAEARSSDQQITFERFSQLENALFAETWMLADALKNADDVDGTTKVKAWRSILQAVLIVLQVGTMFAPSLAKRKRFKWGGLSLLTSISWARS